MTRMRNLLTLLRKVENFLFCLIKYCIINVSHFIKMNNQLENSWTNNKLYGRINDYNNKSQANFENWSNLTTLPEHSPEEKKKTFF